MKTKTKWILRVCGIALVIFIAACWYSDYRDFHEEVTVIEDTETLNEATGSTVAE